jgi:hypothetical protein
MSRYCPMCDAMTNCTDDCKSCIDEEQTTEMQLIENYQSKKIFCMFCGTDKSVKYMKTIQVNGRKATVCCCNKCALLH